MRRPALVLTLFATACLTSTTVNAAECRCGSSFLLGAGYDSEAGVECDPWVRGHSTARELRDLLEMVIARRTQMQRETLRRRPVVALRPEVRSAVETAANLLPIGQPVEPILERAVIDAVTLGSALRVGSAVPTLATSLQAAPQRSRVVVVAVVQAGPPAPALAEAAPRTLSTRPLYSRVLRRMDRNYKTASEAVNRTAMQWVRRFR